MTKSLLSLLGLLWICGGISFAAADASHPNIIYFLCDDLGYGDVHAFNLSRGKIPTPNLDKLASEGMMFTDMHSASSVCTPSRYALMTGRYCWRTHLKAGVLGQDQPSLIGNRLTVPELLKKQGYDTAMFGKWHLGFTFDVPRNRHAPRYTEGVPIGTHLIGGPIACGFDYFLGNSDARCISTLCENDKVIADFLPPNTVVPRICQAAAEYVAKRAGNPTPFFLYVPLNSPHVPIAPSPEFVGKSGINSYGDYVMESDAWVGRILDALDKAGLSGNTLVFFSGDNGHNHEEGNPGDGFVRGEKTLLQAGHYSSAQFRGFKSDIWEGGHREPFIARWPGVVKPGSTCNELACMSSLMATCAELFDVKLAANQGEDSVSILPLLKGSTQQVNTEIVNHSGPGRFALRTPKWKLELCSGSGGSKGLGDGFTDQMATARGLPPIQLYDMTTDEEEQHNVEAQNPEVVAAMTAELKKIVDQGRSTPGAPQKNDVPVDIYEKGARIKPGPPPEDN